ncbi:enoyl-CoA hydratase [Nocardioides sp. BP30]|uniref:enoyl-CoA hydratase n=1 Tax=Nocardioides sp. BP30 TaxID=3036374 RepID=UPI002468BC01|nr:enoyl-CoA hydratase [Nocardioides sp. BP30]WGL54022.1 enoyl-CoA hydratase [Nocardioides sp. BP30]
MSDVRLDRPAPGVAVLTLDRPAKYNALTPGLLAALGGQLRDLAEDPEVRAIVLTGAGAAFCAGLDLDALGGGADFGPDDIAPLIGSPHPIIAAINGVAVTGGLELALACDFRIASTNARFADTHARVGVIPGWGLTARLPQAVGQAWARRMSFTGDYVDATTAHRIGLVSEVTDPDDLLPRAISLASSIATTEPTTLRTIRSVYDEVRDGTGADGLNREAAYASGGFTMADADSFAARREALLARARGGRAQ